jgi:chlorophyll synthase
MAAPQFVVVVLLAEWGAKYHAIAVGAFLLAQLLLMGRLLKSPRERAPWYNATGVSLYVMGMLISAFAVRGLPA